MEYTNEQLEQVVRSDSYKKQAYQGYAHNVLAKDKNRPVSMSVAENTKDTKKGVLQNIRNYILGRESEEQQIMRFCDLHGSYKLVAVFVVPVVYDWLSKTNYDYLSTGTNKVNNFKMHKVFFLEDDKNLAFSLAHLSALYKSIRNIDFVPDTLITQAEVNELKKGNLLELFDNVSDVKMQSIIHNAKDMDSTAQALFSKYTVIDRINMAKKGESLNVLVGDPDRFVRVTVADKGEYLDRLLYDSDPKVRKAVAMQGFGWETLVKDPDSEIRLYIAKQGYGLDMLVNDEDPRIRCEVARQGYGLDVLVNDEDIAVRCIVAEQGYGLETLVNDSVFVVRETVAEQGYGHNILVNDEYPSVREAVAKTTNDPDILEHLVNDIDNSICELAQKKLPKFDMGSIDFLINYATQRSKEHNVEQNSVLLNKDDVVLE